MHLYRAARELFVNEFTKPVVSAILHVIFQVCIWAGALMWVVGRISVASAQEATPFLWVAGGGVAAEMIWRRYWARLFWISAATVFAVSASNDIGFDFSWKAGVVSLALFGFSFPLAAYKKFTDSID